MHLPGHINSVGVGAIRAMELSKGSSIFAFSDDLLVCLRRSLDALHKENPIIKDCFLDLCSFPKGQRISVGSLMDMWAELYDQEEDIMSIANIFELTTWSIANLVATRNVIEGDGYYTEHFVTQHDLLRELAIRLASQDSIGDRKRLILDTCEGNLPQCLTAEKYHSMKARLLSISTDEVFPTEWPNIQLPEAEVLVLNLHSKNYTLPKFGKKMNKLKVLIITNYGLLPADLENFQLLGSLSNLKRLRLEKVSIPSISKNLLQLRSLQKMSLFMCSIGQAFSKSSIQMFGALPNLVEMKIDYCHDLVELPAELCNLTRLEKLSVTNCHKLSALPEEIGNLVNLELLRLRSCTEMLELPVSITNLKKLAVLDISDCFSIQKMPEHIGEMYNLKKLNMSQCSRVRELPASVLDLEQLKDVLCDEDKENLWEPFLPFLKDMHIKVVKDDINLNWLHKLPS